MTTRVLKEPRSSWGYRLSTALVYMVFGALVILEIGDACAGQGEREKLGQLR